MLEVLAGGLLTSVQDGGRPDFVDLGVPIGGACDRWSLAEANLLLGNGPTAAALELTLDGPELAVRATLVVGLAGADLGAVVVEEGRRLAPGAAHLVHGGTRLAFSGGDRGARAYLAVPGGVDVPRVLGGRGTCLAGGFGGLAGRALRAGDRISAARPTDRSAAGRTWPPGGYAPTAPAPVRLLRGPASLAAHVPGAYRALLGGEWHVGAAADRMGIRIIGPGLAAGRNARAAPFVSAGVLPGAVQWPPGGEPIVLLAAAQTVGGYPVVAVVAQADLPRLGQLRPGDPVQFEPIGFAAAQAALAARRAELEAGARAVLGGDPWEALVDQVG